MITAKIEKSGMTTSTYGGDCITFDDYKTPTVGGVVKSVDIYGGDRSPYLAVVGNGSATLTVGGDYFSLWWSAIDKGNAITFLHNGAVVGYFDYDWVTGQLNKDYLGNPVFGGRNPVENYAYVNFFGKFDKILLTNTLSNTNFEADNIRVGSIPEFGVPMISVVGLLLLLRRRCSTAIKTKNKNKNK